jgi:hypothetical protein
MDNKLSIYDAALEMVCHGYFWAGLADLVPLSRGAQIFGTRGAHLCGAPRVSKKLNIQNLEQHTRGGAWGAGAPLLNFQRLGPS